MWSSTSFSSTPPGRSCSSARASQSGVPVSLCRAQRLARPSPPSWAVCWRWASCCCGTARFASESPAAGASPPPACATSGGWVHRWPLSVRPSRRHRCCSSVSSRASARWPSRPTASASAPRASATWQATASRTPPSPSSGRPSAHTAGTWRSGSPGSAP